MARHKTRPVITCKDLEEANMALSEIGDIKRRIASAELSMNEAIDRAKAEAEVKCSPLRERRASLEAALNAFCQFNKATLFKTKKSVEMSFGSMGFRKSTSLVTLAKITWKMVLGKIKELDLEDALRKEEKINKDVLHTWPDERLALIGAARKVEDEFWYETAEIEVGLPSEVARG